MEYAHHGDALVPRQQRFGKYTRSLMKGLGIPVENRYGLRPAVVPGTTQIAPLTVNRDLDTRGWLKGVTASTSTCTCRTTRVTTDDANAVRVLGRQPIDLSRPHPFTEAGNKRVQHLPLDAARRQAGRGHPDGGLHDLQHAVRRRREPAALLEEHRHRAVRRISFWRAGVLPILISLCPAPAHAQTATPVAGHYPPGQSGIRGAATPAWDGDSPISAGSSPTSKSRIPAAHAFAAWTRFGTPTSA